MRTIFLTAALLVVAFGTTLRRPQSETDRELAEDLLESEDVQQVELSNAGDPPAFQAGSRAALFFEGKGMQGLIRGVVVVEGDRVVDLMILQSHEGIGHDALDSPGFCNSFRHRPAKPPLIVDAVSGATISSQAVTDAVNVRLAQWVKYTRQNSALSEYRRRASVTSPGRGKKNHPYSDDEVRKILTKVISECPDEKAVSKTKDALRGLPNITS